MKEKFPEFYNIPDLNELWENCHFIFDTNIFINLYKKYPKKMYEQFIDILEKKIPDRIWMPYQIGLEYHKNRVKQVKDKEMEFKGTISKINGLKGDLKNNCKTPINQIPNKAHFIDLSKYMDLDLINEKFSEIDDLIDSIKENINENTDFLDDDEIRNRIDTIFKDKIGDNYSSTRLKEIYEEGEYRFASKIPPGFEDRNKKNGNPYGDLIIWYQIMGHAEEEGVPIIFVTDEEKKDWWQVYQNNKNKEFIRPNNYLLQEFASTGQEFYMVRFAEFLDKSKQYLEADVESEVIEAVKVIEELQDLEEELEEKETEEITRTGTVNPALQLAAQEARRQAELIRVAGSGSALQLAVREAKRQQEMYRAAMPTFRLFAQEAKRQQEMYNAAMPTFRLFAQEAKRQQEMYNAAMPTFRLAAQEAKRQQEIYKAAMPTLRLAAQEAKKQQEIYRASFTPTLPSATKKAKKSKKDHQEDTKSEEDN